MYVHIYRNNTKDASKGTMKPNMFVRFVSYIH